MMDPEVIAWAEECANGARANLEKYGYVVPVALILTNDEMEAIGLQGMITDKDKDQAFGFIQFHAKAIKARAVLMILESWMRQFEKEEDVPKDGKVERYQDKKECVVFNLATPEGSKVSIMEIITKLPEETKSFGAFKWQEGTVEVTGRAFLKL